MFTISKKLNSFQKSFRSEVISLLVLALFFITFSSVRLTAQDKSAESEKNAAPQLVFDNSAAITVTGGAANNAVPYPSAITVSGVPGTIPATPGSIKVTLNSFSHTFSDDLGIVLVGPTGAALLLQNGCGDDPDMAAVTYTISDAGAAQMPDLTAWTTGTYKPTT